MTQRNHTEMGNPTRERTHSHTSQAQIHRYGDRHGDRDRRTHARARARERTNEISVQVDGSRQPGVV